MCDILYRVLCIKLSFAGHQGSSQFDQLTNTGFGSFKLLTCGWLEKGQITRLVACGLGTCRLTTCNLTHALSHWSYGS